MTSVQNRRLQLSGNKFKAILIALTVILISSCGGTKRVSRPDQKVMTPTVKDNDKSVKKGSSAIDTIFWTEVDRTRDYDKRIEDIDLEKRDSYKVSLLIPFEVAGSREDDYHDPDSKLGRMIQYYSGLKLALTQLETENINLDVEVFDAESGNFDQKLQKSRNADVIIGPRNRDQLSITANYGKNNEIPVISPWLSSSSVAKDNPFYIQLIPSVRDHYARIVEHVKNKYQDEQVFLLGRKKNKDLASMRYIQRLAAAMNNDNNDRPFNEFYVDEDSLRVGEEAFDNIFFEDTTSVFILPNYSFSEDEDFVYNCVRKMSGEKGLKDVVVYGMPILLESDKIKFEHYANLNMHICRSSYVDREDPMIREFKALYFENYNDFPTEEAYKGYDMMMYVGRNMFNYGKRFHYFLDKYESSLLQTVFNVQKVFRDDGASDDFSEIQYHQNKHLYILAFKDYHFRKE
ncbi:MAG: hypothetical protein HKN67_06860 [Saprospiraceae bacterium]|nr:hypothetical protein [Bacteroidia bacterium]MBT8229683.1 hypothetical protein [Bacteroidia bacterium]NNF21643.1 hypothetical protein [Saprospiraceae bacterium]NNK90493.1 hypothetical protein [Saprospiraceae bacterium]